MKAAVFHGVHQPLTIEDIDVDEPRDYEVLVRTAAAGVCHSELHMIEGHSPVPPPAVLGHESAGVVERVGSRVSYVRPGDHVIARGTFCGHCEMCLTGHLNVCTSRPGRASDDAPVMSWNGQRLNQWGSNIFGWSEQMLLHENGVVKISPEMPLDAAALLGCAVITGFGAVMRTAQVEAGTSIAVFGCGGIGLSAIQGGLVSGCQRVIAVDLLDSKLEVAREFGATHTVNASNEDPVDAIRAIADGEGVHYSFDAIGLATVAMQALDCLRPQGTATLIGVIPEETPLTFGWRRLGGEKRIQGCMMGSNRFRMDLPMLVDLYMQGRLKLDEMITTRGSLEDVNDFLEIMKGGAVTRQVMMMDS
ncbi:MAG: Zn-dependent alcohol dehydrogenase [Chloroflexi bacterium]|nr:Zn-dependent alcohol dehydrogenase [Chloroflexota bacterium]